MQKLTTPLLQTLQNRRRTSRVVAANNGKVLVRSALSSTDSFWAKYSDLYTIVLSASWLQLLAGFTVINVFMWTFFGTVFYAMRHHKQADGVTSCVDNMNSYAEAIFFAVETIQTIGYGNIAPGSQGGCVPEIVTVCIMVMCALLVHTLVVGTIVYKAYMPQNRALTVKFSETMIHTRRDGVDYLAFRVADIRKKNLCAMHVTGVVYMEVSTNEGQALDLEARNLEIIPQYNSTPLLLPQVFLHPLRSGSPLAFLTQENAADSDLEIVVILEGISQVTGLNTQARQSYLVRNIQWNRNFVRMVSRAGDEKKPKSNLRAKIANQVDWRRRSEHSGKHTAGTRAQNLIPESSSNHPDSSNTPYYHPTQNPNSVEHHQHTIEPQEKWLVDFSLLSATVPSSSIRSRTTSASGNISTDLSNVRIAAGEECYPTRLHVGTNNCDWSRPFPQYAPTFFAPPQSQPASSADSGSSSSTTTAATSANEIASSLVNLPQWSLCGPVMIGRDGLALNPHGRTGVAGVGNLPRWGPNVRVALLLTRRIATVTAVNGAPTSSRGDGATTHTGVLELLVSSEDDSFANPELPEYSLILPAPPVLNSQDGVTSLLDASASDRAAALLRRTGGCGESCRVNSNASTILSAGYVDDTRNTDNAWREMAALSLVADCNCSTKVHRPAGSVDGGRQEEPQRIQSSGIPTVEHRNVRWVVVSPATLEIAQLSILHKLLVERLV